MGKSSMRTSRAQWWQWFRDTERRQTIAIAVLAFILGYILAARYGLNPYTLWLRWHEASGIEPWRRAAMRADPPIGKRIELSSLQDVKGKRVTLPSPNGYTALVFMQDPRACHTNRVLRGIRERQLQGRLQNVHLFIVVPTTRPERARQMWRMWEHQYDILLDDRAVLAKRLNAIFDHRGYLFDAQSRLLYRTSYRQPEEQVEEEVLRIVGGR